MSEQQFDVLVVGGGPGGYVAAIRAAQLGMRTALVEREHLGGTCLNWGCIPTKALLHSANAYRQLKGMAALGIRIGDVSVDLQQIVERSRAVARQLNQGVEHLLKKNKVKVWSGVARLDKPGSVVVEGATGEIVLHAKHIILATGARPRELPGIAVDGIDIWNYRHALTPQQLPASLLVVGAGAIGMEFACFYAALGSKVTVVETQERILPVEDDDISAFMRHACEAQGIAFRTGSVVAGIDKTAAGMQSTLHTPQGSDTIVTDKVLVSIGVVGNTSGLGLEGTRVAIDKGSVLTDCWGQTGEPGIYAIGDLAGAPWLAHKASHEGVLCVEKIAGLDNLHAIDRLAVPACTYGFPQVASIGLTERAARERGHAVRVGRFPFAANGKAIVMAEAEGLVKTIFERDTGELLGAHLVGPEVSELIHGFALAKTLESTEVELLQTIFPHPSLSEALHESVLSAHDRALHI